MLPTSRSRGGRLYASASATPRDGARTWFNLSLVLNVLLLFLAIKRHKTPREPAPEALQLSKQIDNVVQHTEELLRSVRGEVQSINSNLDTARGVLERELVRPAPVVTRAVPTAVVTAAGTDQHGEGKPSDGSGGGAAPVVLAPCKRGSNLWLTIGIPTIPRKGVDYLTTTLESLVGELPSDPTDPLYNNIRVIVMNNRPGQHEPFAQLKQRIEAADPDDRFAIKAGSYLQLVDNPGTVQDPAPPGLPDPDDLNNPEDRPGREVRRQTCDLITLMDMAAPLSEYYMFMEDDFSTCLNGLRAVHYLVVKLNTVPALRSWFAARVSYGMNGIVMRSTDLGAFSSYLRNHTVRLPPDLLWLEWFQGKREAAPYVAGRFLAVYKYNLLDHIGTVSSFTVRQDRPKWPGCFVNMAKAWSLHVKERFSATRCRRSDVTPCPPDDSEEEWTKHPIEWPREGQTAPGQGLKAARAQHRQAPDLDLEATAHAAPDI